MAEAHSNYGNVLKHDGQLDAAHEHYQRALQINPRLASVYCNIARALQQVGQLDESVLRFQQALEIEPHNVQFHCWLASALLDQRRYDEADVRIQIASRIDPDSHEPHLSRSLLLEEQEQFEASLACLREAQQLSPDNAHVLVRIGGVSQSLGHRDEARAAYRAALQIRLRMWCEVMNVKQVLLLLAVWRMDQHGANYAARSECEWTRIVDRDEDFIFTTTANNLADIQFHRPESAHSFLAAIMIVQQQFPVTANSLYL